jgi:hypothetical protein
MPAPALVCRVPSLKFVSLRLNLDKGWVTYSRKRHCADTQSGTHVRLLAARSQYGTLKARWKDCLPHAVICSSWNNLSHGPDS